MNHSNLLLIADHNPHTSTQTARLLETAGYQVLRTATAAECLNLVHAEHPGLILIEASLPGIDDLNAYKQLRSMSDWKQAIVVLIVEENQTPPLPSRKVDACLVRPFSDQELLGRVRDWFQLKQINDELHAVEARWRLLLRSIPSFIAELDLDGTILTLNKVLPLSATEHSLGKPALQVLAPANREKLQRAIDDVVKKGISVDYEAQDSGPDSSQAWYYFRLVPIIKDGTVKSLILVLDDVTKRKQAEAQLRFQAQLLDSVRESVVATDLDGKIIYWGKGAETLYGYRAEEVKGKSVTLIVEPHGHDQERLRMRHTLKTGLWRGQYRQKHKEGHTFWADTIISLVIDEQGQPVGFVGIDRDITGLKETEATLRHRIELETLIATISTNFINLAPDKIDDAINQALEMLGKLVSVDRSYVFLFSDDGRRMSNTYEWCAPGVTDQQQNLQNIPVEKFPWWTQKLRNFEHIYISRVKDMPPEAGAEQRLMADQNVQSLIAVPMIHSHQLIGFLGFDSIGHETAWNYDDINLLNLVSNIFVNAHIRQQADKKVEQRNRELAILNRIITAISYSLELPEILNTLKTLLPIQLNMFAGAILLYDQSRHWLSLQASWGLPATMSLALTSLPVDALRSKQAIQTQKVILSSSLDDIADLFDIDSDQTTWNSQLTIPLLAKNQIQGIIVLLSPAFERFQEFHMSFFETLGRQIGITIENARLFEQVRAGREQSRRLTQQVVSAQEEERKRLSRELHDEAGQALTALKIAQELIQVDLPANLGQIRQRMSEVIQLTDTTIEQIRLLAHDLRPPALDTLGLNPTLEGYCREFGRRTHLTITYVGTDLPDAAEVVGISLYRFLQEALTNAIKHAEATAIQVRLRHENKIISLVVSDNGKGFKADAFPTAPASNTGIGLLGIQERLELLGGWLEIVSQPNQGVQLTAYVPWEG